MSAQAGNKAQGDENNFFPNQGRKSINGNPTR